MSRQLIDLRGIWIGEYGPHGKEIVKITEDSKGTLTATKVTGDRNMPAETVSFEMPPGMQGVGRGQVADIGYRHPRWVDATGCVFSKDAFKVDFFAVGSISFRRLEETGSASAYQFDIDGGAPAAGDNSWT
jgi:hypothetical protein